MSQPPFVLQRLCQALLAAALGRGDQRQVDEVALRVAAAEAMRAVADLAQMVGGPLEVAVAKCDQAGHDIGPDRTDDVSPYAAPGRAVDLAGLPPAYVMTAELDPLRDDGLRYAARLLEAGVSVELHQFAGAFHGFDLFPTALSQRALDEQVAWVVAVARSTS